MSEKLEIFKTAHDALSGVGDALLQKYLTSELGLSSTDAAVLSALALETFPAVALYVLNQRLSGLTPRSRESIETNRLLSFLGDLANSLKEGKLYAYKIEMAIADSPHLIDLIDRIVRCVEQEAIRSKIKFQSNLAVTCLSKDVPFSQSEEFDIYSRAILELNSIELELLSTAVSYDLSGKFGDSNNRGEVFSTFGSNLTIGDIKRLMGLGGKGHSVITLRPQDRQIPEGFFSAALSRLALYGFIELPHGSTWGGAIGYKDESKLKVNATAHRFVSWCKIEIAE